MPPETGACATSAASQPASAGEVQSLVVVVLTAPVPALAGWSVPCRPRRNQSDSTDSNIGSLFSSPRLAGGGTITPCCAVWLTSLVNEDPPRAPRGPSWAPSPPIGMPKEAIKLGGSSVSDYVDSEGREGFFQLQHRVYLRTGEPCLTCKTPIKRIVVAGRGTHYCPKCQK